MHPISTMIGSSLEAFKPVYKCLSQVIRSQRDVLKFILESAIMWNWYKQPNPQRFHLKPANFLTFLQIILLSVDLLINQQNHLCAGENNEQSDFDSILVLSFLLLSFAHLNNEVLNRYKRNLNLILTSKVERLMLIMQGEPCIFLCLWLLQKFCLWSIIYF